MLGLSLDSAHEFGTAKLHSCIFSQHVLVSCCIFFHPEAFSNKLKPCHKAPFPPSIEWQRVVLILLFFPFFQKKYVFSPKWKRFRACTGYLCFLVYTILGHYFFLLIEKIVVVVVAVVIVVVASTVVVLFCTKFLD